MYSLSSSTLPNRETCGSLSSSGWDVGALAHGGFRVSSSLKASEVALCWFTDCLRASDVVGFDLCCPRSSDG